MRLKLRVAAEEGTPYVPLGDGRVRARAQTGARIFVVEGRYDAEILNRLADIRGVHQGVVVISAMGRLNLPLVALAQLALTPQDRKQIILVADADGNAGLTRENITTVLRDAGVESRRKFETIVLSPNLEAALGLAEAAGGRTPPRLIEERLRAVDLDARAASDSELARMLRALDGER
jgi:hypothetical protein